MYIYYVTSQTRNMLSRRYIVKNTASFPALEQHHYDLIKHTKLVALEKAQTAAIILNNF